jgi:ABC-2 type transport system ATP-binding protein
LKVSVRNVTKQFRSSVAVDDVSFDIPASGFFGLLGPNGAGKTTLIRMMIDILRPDSGDILYEGRPLCAEDKDTISYLPEERGLYQKMKVKDMLNYFGQLKGLPAAAVRRNAGLYLERLEMTGTMDRKVEELSKGNQQKIQLAGVLVSDPQMIILDEPFSGLDPLNVRLLKAVLMEERHRGKTILLSTHQMDQVEELCDNLIMLHHGRLVLYGGTQEVIEEYAESAMLVDVPELNNHLPGVERVVPHAKGYRIYPQPGVDPLSILRYMLDEGYQVDGFQKTAVTLEEIFVKVARRAPGEEKR